MRLAHDPNPFLATTQIFITLAGFLASAIAAVALAEPLVPVLSALGAAAEPVAIAVVTLALTFLTLVFGELSPKRIAMQRGAGVGAAWRPGRSTAPSPAAPGPWSGCRPGGLRATPWSACTGADPRAQPAGSHDPGELAGHGGFTQRKGVLRADQRDDPQWRAGGRHDRMLREVLVPRRVGGHARRRAADHRHRAATQLGASPGSPGPRSPGRRGLDEVVGVVHLRRACTGDGTRRGRLPSPTPALFLPETPCGSPTDAASGSDAPGAAAAGAGGGRARRRPTASSLMEDLVEEIVGEIYDETDQDLATITRLDDGRIVVPGTFPLHDLPDLGIELSDPTGDYTTVSGLVMDKLVECPPAPVRSPPSRVGASKSWTSHGTRRPESRSPPPRRPAAPPAPPRKAEHRVRRGSAEASIASPQKVPGCCLTGGASPVRTRPQPRRTDLTHRRGRGSTVTASLLAPARH